MLFKYTWLYGRFDLEKRIGRSFRDTSTAPLYLFFIPLTSVFLYRQSPNDHDLGLRFTLSNACAEVDFLHLVLYCVGEAGSGSLSGTYE